jgi:hypothetical protein
MKYLGNGMYQIQNTKTGETRNVKASDLPQYGLSAPKQNTSSSPDIAGDVGVGLAGGIGGSIGQAIGTPFDLLTGPVGTMAGGATLGGLAQGGAEATRELLHGQGLNWGDIASQGAQGAMWGAVPFGEEARTAKTAADAASDVLGSIGVDTAKEDVASNLTKVAGKWGTKQIAKRVAYGGVAGMGTQSVQDIRAGKNPLTDPNVLVQGGIGSALNAISPGLSDIVGAIPKTLTGTSGKIYERLAQYMVGSGLDNDPVVKGSLVYQDAKDATGAVAKDGAFWQKSIQNLTANMQKVWKPLQTALENHTDNLGAWMDQVKNGLKQSNLSNETINNNLSAWVENMTRKAGGQADAIMQKIKYNEDLANSTYGKAGGDYIQKILNGLWADLRNMDLPGNVLNEGKMMIGDIRDDAPAAYSNAKNYIENMIGDDAPTAKINDTYNNLREASDNIRKNFEGKTRIPDLNKNVGFMQRFGTMIGGTAVGTLFGLPGASPCNLSQGIGGGAIALLTMLAKDAATSTPERADKYAQVLEKVYPGLGKLFNQELLRQNLPYEKKLMGGQ